MVEDKPRNIIRKKCPYCDAKIGKSGWKMHMDGKHGERVFVVFESVGKSGAQEESFREEPTKRKRTPNPKGDYQTEYRPDEQESEEESDDWGTLLDD